MNLDQFQAVDLATEQAWYQVIHGTHGDHRHPTQRTGMHVTNGPVGVVRQGVNCLDCHHRAFEGRHTVERNGHDQEAQYRVGTQLFPRPGQRHDAVDHAAPARSQQD